MSFRALIDIGYLDENLPGCFEDVDYSWRAVKMGYRLVEVPIPVAHVDYGRLDHRVNESHAIFRKKWNL
jgi:GT2 family glycosyltransferase